MLASDSTTTISYQGRLADSSGDPVTTSGVGMQFRLYNTDTGGSSQWQEPHTAVPVEDGLFHVLLGSTNPIPVSLLANNSTLWLGITVGADSEMTPREQIASVPYAMIASTVADGAITTDKIADEAVTQVKLGPDVSLEPPDGSITTGKLADEAVTSAKIAHQFGASNEPLLNYVIRQNPSSEDYNDTAATEWTTWDLNPIIGNTAVAVTLDIEIWDDEVGSYFWARQKGEGFGSEDIQGIEIVKAGNSHHSQFTVEVDANQCVEFKKNRDLDGLRVTVVGWWEPAHQ
jgi:hypothetical protein